LAASSGGASATSLWPLASWALSGIALVIAGLLRLPPLPLEP